jgi:hypothetical protein
MRLPLGRTSLAFFCIAKLRLAEPSSAGTMVPLLSVSDSGHGYVNMTAPQRCSPASTRRLGCYRPG